MISNPESTGKPISSASSGLIGIVRTPSAGRRTRPSVIRSFSTAFAVLMGMAKPMPAFCPTLGKNHGIDADDFPMPVHQWAAGVAGIDRRIGLNGFINHRAARFAHRPDRTH